MTDENEEKQGKKRRGSKDVRVTIHYADGGPRLEDCMVSVLRAHLSMDAEQQADTGKRAAAERGAL